jgi:hypothetical protein
MSSTTSALLVAAVLVGLGATASSILLSPYASDDVANSGIHAVLAKENWTLWDMIVHYTQVWIGINGRFFPGSLAWSYGVFYVFDDRLEYKIVLVIVLAVASAVVALFAVAITRSRRVAFVVGVFLIAVLQIRLGFDGLTSFAGLISLTTALSLGACVLLCWRRGAGWAIAAGVAYAFALLTYETVLLFAPVMIAVIVLVTRSWIRTIPIVVPAILVAVMAIVLRTVAAREPGPAYSLSLDPVAIGVTFAKQSLAALPLSQWWLGELAMPPIDPTVLVLCATVIGIPVMAGLMVVSRRPLTIPRLQLAVLAGSGAWIWLVPSALIAVTLRWQEELQFGQGYIGVVFGYFGFALLMTSVWVAVTMVVGGDRKMRAGRVLAWRIASSATIGLICAGTVAGNLAIAGTF